MISIDDILKQLYAMLNLIHSYDIVLKYNGVRYTVTKSVDDGYVLFFKADDKTLFKLDRWVEGDEALQMALMFEIHWPVIKHMYALAQKRIAEEKETKNKLANQTREWLNTIPSDMYALLFGSGGNSHKEFNSYIVSLSVPYFTKPENLQALNNLIGQRNWLEAHSIAIATGCTIEEGQQAVDKLAQFSAFEVWYTHTHTDAADGTECSFFSKHRLAELEYPCTCPNCETEFNESSEFLWSEKILKYDNGRDNA